jgi:hypothetical protein
MAEATSLTVYKSFYGSGLPFYKVGSLKGFQLEGNYYNYAIDLIQVDDHKVPAFITDYVSYSAGSYAVSLLLYELDSEKLKVAITYEDLVAARGSYTTIPISTVLKETKLTSYDRYYTNEISLSSVLDAGVYELVLTDSSGRVFESEIFSNCIFKETTFSNVVCSSASCPNVTTGNRPVFTITITETNGVPVDWLQMKVNWNVGESVKFDLITFPFRFGDESLNTEETQTFSLLASEAKVLTFTYPNIVDPGTYTMSYLLNKGTCSGTITFTIGNPCIEFVSGIWT